MELHERIDPGDGKAKKTEANGSSKAVKLHERIKSRQPQTDSEADGRPPDPFAELKTSLHLAIISELGPQLYNAGGDAGELIGGNDIDRQGFFRQRLERPGRERHQSPPDHEDVQGNRRNQCLVDVQFHPVRTPAPLRSPAPAA